MLYDTLKFPDLLRKLPPKGIDEEDVSYDVEALFTSIPIDMTIDYIIEEIYEREAIKPLCKKLIFKRFLKRLTSGCTFSANGKLIRQLDGCPIGGNFSQIMASICMTKCLKDVIKPLDPIYFGLYVDDGFSRRKLSNRDKIGEGLQNFHPKLKFTTEVEPNRFLDSEFVKSPEGKNLSIKVFQKPNKFPTHWSSQTPKRYKRNAINCELHRAFCISDDFDSEVDRIRTKYQNASFPIRFINECIQHFRFSRFEQIIPKTFFENTEAKPTIRLRIPFCRKNENLSRTFLKKLKFFIGDSYDVFLIWNTTKIRTLFPLKDKNLHPHCLIYEGTCTCGAKYVGETDRCFHLRTGEHEDIKKASEPAKHLKGNRDHSFSWKILAHAPRDFNKRKILEAFFISKFRPCLNEQVHSRKLILFRNGIT